MLEDFFWLLNSFIICLLRLMFVKYCTCLSLICSSDREIVDKSIVGESEFPPVESGCGGTSGSQFFFLTGLWPVLRLQRPPLPTKKEIELQVIKCKRVDIAIV